MSLRSTIMQSPDGFVRLPQGMKTSRKFRHDLAGDEGARKIVEDAKVHPGFEAELAFTYPQECD